MHIVLLVRLGDSRLRFLHRHDFVRLGLLTIFCDSQLGILQQGFPDSVLVTERTADQQFVVPCVSSLGVVPAQLLCHEAATLLELDPPVQVGCRVLLEEHAVSELGGQTLIQSLLVEEEGVLEGRERPGEKRRPREDDAGPDPVLGFPGHCERLMRF